MNKVLVFLHIGLLSCSSGVTDKGQSNEDFFVFFQRFCMDKSFQVSRIKFPLQNIYLSENLNEVIIDEIPEWNWEYLRIKDFENNTFEYYFDSFQKKELPEKDEMIYSINGIENGTQVNYYFKRENIKWYLIKIEDLST